MEVGAGAHIQQQFKIITKEDSMFPDKTGPIRLDKDRQTFDS